MEAPKKEEKAGARRAPATAPGRKGLPAALLAGLALLLGLGLGIAIGLALGGGDESEPAPELLAKVAELEKDNQRLSGRDSERSGLLAKIEELEDEKQRLSVQLADNPDTGEVSTRCVRVLDGDTLEAEGIGKVRYLGINTPEKYVDFYAKEAFERNRELVEGQRIRVVYDGSKVDDLGRNLGYIYVGDVLINLELLKGGFAKLFDDSRTKKIREYQLFLATEKEARESERGLWNEEARAAWETGFQAEPYYMCTHDRVHRPSCQHAGTIRVDSIEEAMQKRKACGYCIPTRNHPQFSTTTEEEK